MPRWTAWLLLAGLFTGCVDKLTLENRPCPCAGGWQCCGQDSLCIPDDQICEGGQPCSAGCDQGQYCWSDICEVCDDNRHCGIECTDCGDLSMNTACVDGRCGCRDYYDCAGRYTCQDSLCTLPATDGGTDAGTGDGGPTDGGSDGGSTCRTNKSCGSECLDCTASDVGNWACVNGVCGCRDPSDCLPDQNCSDGQCISQGSDGGLDGGVDGDGGAE